jgi:hypothetical protein
MKYPYYIVACQKGRLADQVPIYYRHTPMERMIKTGQIGGKKTIEHRCVDPKEAQIIGFEEERNGSNITVYKIFGPSMSRKMCSRWRARNWRGD